jgi:choline dehydrogenase
LNTSVLANSTLLEEALDQWKSSRTGPLSDVPTNNLVWGRLPANSPFGDPSSGPNAPHWELILAVNLGSTPEPHVVAAISIVSPTSRK